MWFIWIEWNEEIMVRAASQNEVPTMIGEEVNEEFGSVYIGF